jgi:hypothetical protein
MGAHSAYSKVCIKCGSSDRYPSGDCRQCRKDRGKRRQGNPRVREQERIRNQNPHRLAWNHAHQLQKYGLTVDAYDAMVLAQKGLCAICARPPGDSRLHVDHCHKTGQVRGLLCGRCNTAIGLLGDDPKILAMAISYIQKPRVQCQYGNCFRSPVGAYLGRKGWVWYFCDAHEDPVNQLVCEHADMREFPLERATMEEIPVYQVMMA